MHAIRIRANPNSRVSIEVDGRDVANDVVGYKIEHHVGEIPTLTLTLYVGSIDIEGQAEVEGWERLMGMRPA
jgi:hypothetical protein